MHRPTPSPNSGGQLHPDLKIASPTELIALCKGKQGNLSYSQPSTGSPHHLAFEYFKKIAGIDVQHVAYRGAGPAVQDAVAGQVPITVSGLPPVMELIKSGTLRAVALTSAKRSSLQQDRQGLFVGDLCAGLELWQGATTDGMLDHQEGITRQTQHACNIARRHLEGLGAQHHRSLAELFETNTVVQTAR
jgi:Tripartite tricarboxylate transporter family receptor